MRNCSITGRDVQSLKLELDNKQKSLKTRGHASRTRANSVQLQKCIKKRGKDFAAFQTLCSGVGENRKKSNQ